MELAMPPFAVLVIATIRMTAIIEVRRKAGSAIRIVTPVPRPIPVDVPALLNKKYRIKAGAVVAAVLWPVLVIQGRYAQVDRRVVHPSRCRLNHDRRGVHNRWHRVVDQIDLAVIAGVAYWRRRGQW